jgi:hypothetical protein
MLDTRIQAPTAGVCAQSLAAMLGCADQIRAGRPCILRHCEERSDEAIHAAVSPFALDCFAPLAMTALSIRHDRVPR